MIPGGLVTPGVIGVIPRAAFVAPGGAAAFPVLRFRWNDTRASLTMVLATSVVSFKTASVLEKPNRLGAPGNSPPSVRSWGLLVKKYRPARVFLELIR